MNVHALRVPVTFAGIGLHTGQHVTVVVHPAEPGTGRQFRRTDIDGPPVPASAEHVTSTSYRTAVGRSGVSVSTVEHLLACLHGLGVHDAWIDVGGPEIPIGDGSTTPFASLLDTALSVTEPVARVCSVAEPFRIQRGRSRYSVRPGPGLTLTVTFHHAHPLIGRQSLTVAVTREHFMRDLAWARTFGMLEDRAGLAKLGLARGASVDNVLVLDRRGLVAGTLRRADEFVRHKALDLLGDLALVDARIEAHITAEQPSHAGNVELARALQSHLLENVEA